MEMAETLDSISCPICLDVMKDPVTIPCGHSYCMGCIKGCWDKNGQKRIRCPLCQETYHSRPVLRINMLLAELVEKLKRIELQAAHPALYYAGPGDIACDVCIGRKLKALKSCLVCLASYCETHLIPHYEAPAFKKHKLVTPSIQLREKICSRHDKVLELFCVTDQKCICYLCSVKEHKCHETVLAVDAKTEKKSQLRGTKQEVQKTIQDREKDLKNLQQAAESLKGSVQVAVDDSEMIFAELIRSIERKRSEVKELISAQQKKAMSRANGLLKQLEEEIADLRMRDAELEQLLLTEDHILFLQRYQSLSSTSSSSNLPSTIGHPLLYFRDVSEALSTLREELEDFLEGKWTRISNTVNSVDVLPPQPRTRADFLQHSCRLTLNCNTAHTHLYLSQGDRKVTNCLLAQSYPDHPERFTNGQQVLCKEGLSGRHYWEVERSGRWISAAVTSKDINRTGSDDSEFGNNEKSWRLEGDVMGFRFKHNDVETKLQGPQSSRVGVYLDYRAGTLSFYSVSEDMTLLYKVQTTFTQPLYPGIKFGGWFGDSAEFCKLD